MSGYLGSKQSVALYDSYTKGQQDSLLANFAGIPIGVPFGVWDHLTGVVAPSNTGVNKFIKLTAGEDGVGQYNQGLLTAESVSGTAPLVVATAQIATGPMAGDTVNLANTEGRYLKPGVASGTVANDQMQQITGRYDVANNAAELSPASTSGALSALSDSVQVTRAATASGAPYALGFDSANSPSARTGTGTDTKHAQATYYMRIV